MSKRKKVEQQAPVGTKIVSISLIFTVDAGEDVEYVAEDVFNQLRRYEGSTIYKSCDGWGVPILDATSWADALTLEGKTLEYGIVRGVMWAYCNVCKWKGPDRFHDNLVHADLALHIDTPGHLAQIGGGEGSDV